MMNVFWATAILWKTRLKPPGGELEEKYELKARGYDFDWAVSRVAKALDLIPEQIRALHFGGAIWIQKRRLSQTQYLGGSHKARGRR